MEPLYSPWSCKQATRSDCFSGHPVGIKPKVSDKPLPEKYSEAYGNLSWNQEHLMSSPPLTTTSAPSISASPLQHIPPADLNLTPDVELQTPFSFQFADADETGHHEFEIVQTRCDRRREQNRKAQRAYRARKEAQLKAASTTLFEKQTQLQSLDNHNKALMETIEQLKATITRLEIENQALKANSPSMGGFDETSFWVAEPVTTASCASAVEVLWELHANLTRP